MKRSPLTRHKPLRASAPAKAEVPLLRMRKCANCRQSFRPFTSMTQWCNTDCGAALGMKKLEQQKAREHRAKLADVKPLSHWLDKAEKAVNRYVRARDFHLGCVSCDKPAGWDGQWHASHLRSVGAASAVRFNLWNIHKACWICNKLYSGRIDAYKPQAVERIGATRVDWLYTQNHRASYRRDYLERLARVFNKKAARQEKRNAR